MQILTSSTGGFSELYMVCFSSQGKFFFCGMKVKEMFLEYLLMTELTRFTVISIFNSKTETDENICSCLLSQRHVSAT